MFIAILTLIAYPIFGIWCFNKGREIERDIVGERLSNIVKNVKNTEKFYEERADNQCN